MFFFKYYNFAAGLLSDVIHAAGLGLDVPLLDVLLPVGISFYTFQALGYTIDVYRKDVEAEKNFIDYALFISFFPQLVAGPIERSGHILHQLKEYHPFRYENIKTGIYPVLWGLFKKVVIADNLASMVNTVYNHPQNQGGGAFLVATVAFAFQIYCDFSAYSDIARGSARMLGFRLMENFDCPYFAASIQDFWRRWHISLSSWFKDYLYFPLGGSRKGKARTCLNVMIVFFVSGLWHGAALTFVAWGLLNGLYQVVSKLIDPLRQKLLSRLPIRREGAPYRCFQVAVTFVLTCIAWVLFRANSLPDALTAYQAICSIPVWGFGTARLEFSGHTLGLPMAALVVAPLRPAPGRHGLAHPQQKPLPAAGPHRGPPLRGLFPAGGGHPALRLLRRGLRPPGLRLLPILRGAAPLPVRALAGAAPQAIRALAHTPCACAGK